MLIFLHFPRPISQDNLQIRPLFRCVRFMTMFDLPPHLVRRQYSFSLTHSIFSLFVILHSLSSIFLISHSFKSDSFLNFSCPQTQYSGYIQVDAVNDRNIFYWFTERFSLSLSLSLSFFFLSLLCESFFKYFVIVLAKPAQTQIPCLFGTKEVFTFIYFIPKLYMHPFKLVF